MRSPATQLTNSAYETPISAEQSSIYKAFLSYSHKDLRQAQRLHRRLEHYRIPKTLRQGHVHLGAIFRDKDELSAASELDASIKAALRASEYLIVLCSPHSAASLWVDKEIQYFQALGREDRILTVMLSGEPFAARNGCPAADECFPHALRYDLAETGEIVSERAEPLAVDLRAGGDGEKLGLLKLISGLLGVGLDRVLQRQLIRDRRNLLATLIGSFLLISIFAGLSWATYNAQKQAEARQADAENFVEFLLNDMSIELETSGRLDLLETVGSKAVDYYDQFGDGDLDARGNGRYARALHFTGNLQNSLGKTEESEGFFEQAYALTQAGLAESPRDPDRVFEHARSAYLRSLPLRQKRDYQAERVQLKEYASLGSLLEVLENGSARSVAERAIANMNMGRVRLRIDEYAKAQKDLTTAEALFERLNGIDPTIQNLLYQTENMAWLAEFYRSQGNAELSYDYRVKQDQLLGDKLKTRSDDFRLIEASVYAKLGLGNAARLLGQTEDAKMQLSFALNGTEHALDLEPRREKMRRAQSIILLSLMKLAISENDSVGLQKAGKAMQRLQSHPLTTSSGDSRYWDDVLPRLIADLDTDPN